MKVQDIQVFGALAVAGAALYLIYKGGSAVASVATKTKELFVLSEHQAAANEKERLEAKAAIEANVSKSIESIKNFWGNSYAEAQNWWAGTTVPRQYGPTALSGSMSYSDALEYQDRLNALDPRMDMKTGSW